MTEDFRNTGIGGSTRGPRPCTVSRLTPRLGPSVPASEPNEHEETTRRRSGDDHPVSAVSAGEPSEAG